MTTALDVLLAAEDRLALPMRTVLSCAIDVAPTESEEG